MRYCTPKKFSTASTIIELPLIQKIISLKKISVLKVECFVKIKTMLFNRNRFKNPHVENINRSLFHYLLWQLGFYNDTDFIPPLPSDFVYPNTIESGEGLYKVTWINHSTFLIEAEKIVFLTDPIFTIRCSPFSFIGPKRKHLPKPPLECLPKIDFILISHNHYDHMDKIALKSLHKKNPTIKWIVPMGVKKWFLKHMKKVEADSIIELQWYETVTLKTRAPSIKCTSVPAQHFSGRGVFDKNTTLWMGIVIEIEEKRFYFAGDTGYNAIDFQEIGRRFKKMDLSLLPIGVYRPRLFMQNVHINPDEAVQIHEDVHSCLSVGGHWKTFRLAHEELDRPPFDLYHALKKRGIPHFKFRVLNPGQTISW